MKLEFTYSVFGKGKALKCPNCGSPIELRKIWQADKGFVEKVTCLHCPEPSEKKILDKESEQNILPKTPSVEFSQKKSPFEIYTDNTNEDDIYQEFLIQENNKDRDKDKIKQENKISNKPEKINQKLTKTGVGQQISCNKEGCREILDYFNSKSCKLCGKKVCFKHLQPENHDCEKVVYTKYIRKTWLRKYGQNVSSGRYIVTCETCGYVSQYPQLIEDSGRELVIHLGDNNDCKKNKRTFLEEIDTSPVTERVKVESSVIIDPDRKLWVCAHCRPPQKFKTRDEYIAHHFVHS